MLKSEILVASPRKYGNTFTLSNHFNNLLDNSNTKSHLVDLYKYEIKPCMDCRGCKTDLMKCIQKDEFETIAEKLESADLIVFASPIYWYTPTAKMKLFIDRLRPYYSNKKLSGKMAAIILCSSSGEVDCDLTVEMYRRIFNTFEMNFLGVVISKAYDLGEAAKDIKAIKDIKKLSEKILSLSHN
jgi:multimeric flavodoxin WrbA